ncbi:T9SS type A sorting domain-containing protein [Flavobacterium sp.]|uniref:T9SS type A sorting domain-containing protein n=1 Tax=Flavobacterium sp. TaxID=239 RepID=UPI0025D8D419|nr:T9SS type A sorting domain-containing protein [Flavobacterium sp.]
MKKKLLIACLLTSCFLTAQNIFQDNLATYTVGSSLHSQGLWSHNNDAANGGFGAGACNPVTSGGSCSSSNVVSNSISYLNYGTSAKSLEIAGFLDNPGHPLQPVIIGGDLYVGMVLNIATAPTVGSASDFFRAANSDTSLITFRLLVQDAGTGYKVGIKKGSSANLTVYTNGIFNYNQDNLVILKYSHLSGTNNDILNLYINPDYASGEPVIPSATTNTGTNQSGNIDRIFFRFGFNNAGALPTGFAGLVSAARTWFNLGFIPLSVEQFNSNSFTVLGNNASKGIITINSKMALTNSTLNIYSITGQLLETKKISIGENNNDITINPIHQASVYVVELITEDGSKFIKKIITN